MKPLLLRFKGLHSYRSQQEVDFQALAAGGLFGIFGPTGAGKSTVPDAITLALYGNVERATRGTQGIINLAEKSCEVSFRFALSGHIFTAQRLFERVKNEPFNVKSDKCRLVNETEQVILADKTTDMNQAVEQLLGMDMERFTQTVILPQGKFDRFLRLAPAQRGNLLEDIFHLQAYGDILRNRAKAVADGLEQALSLAEKELALLGDCAPEQVRAAEVELAACQARLAEAASRREHSQAVLQATEGLSEKAAEQQRLQQTLTGLVRQEPTIQAQAAQLAAAERAAGIQPLLKHVEERYKAQQQAVTLAEEKQQAAAQAQKALARAEEGAAAAQATLARQRTAAEQEAQAAEQAAHQLAGQEAAQQQAWQEAEAALQAAQQADAAGMLAATLATGKPCPVCGSREHAQLAHSSGADLAALEKARSLAFAAWQKTAKERDATRDRLQQAQQKQLQYSAAQTQPQQQAELATAQTAAKERELAAQLAQAESQSLSKELAALRAQALEEAARQGFASVNEARKAILDDGQRQVLAAAQQQYRTERQTAEQRLSQLAGELQGYEEDQLQARRQEARLAHEAWQAVLVEEGKRAQALETLHAHSLRWQELQAQMAAQAGRRDTARQLQKLLTGKAFVRYLARERLRELAAEASYTIGMLSNQRYQLQLFEGSQGSDFIIVDQFNAGQRRPVATLSGGEIFLVSLSLALALSRKIEMQGAPLGFFFLDEGFGTLDESMLESVMSILERLPSDKRLVGLISHVAEVKARLPRYLEVIPATDQTGSQIKIAYN